MMNELNTLITQMLEDNLSERDAKRLQAILRDSAEARRLYAEQCQIHAQISLNPELKELLKAEEPIDVDGDTEESTKPEKGVFARRFVSQVSVMAASVAISAVGILSVMHFSSKPATESASLSLEPSSPEKAYEQAEFPENGNLKRPPTNFAVITPDGSHGKKISFNRDIRPILSDNCFHCHGPDAASRKAELRLDIEANAFKAHGKFEAAIVRGDAEKSPLYQRIMSPLKSEMMPPPDSHRSLTEAQKVLIGEWINQGAEWEGHWAFSLPEKKTPPPSDWSEGTIDAFVSALHVENGLKPNPEADRATLARRLSLDLTGLPATPQKVAAFVEDQSPSAYEDFVDSLLGDASFGEHQARYWLDAARYADTHGLHLDNYREIWPYRDWVVESFNKNKPFDVFTVEQIAGDLLPGAGNEQILATGFNRCNPTTSEGGAIEEEYRTIYAQDRVETTATVYLGLTMGCASCHDHKFDPVSQKDFYQFAAFFNNIDGPVMDGNAYDTKPNLVMPQSEHVAEWDELSAAYDAIGKEIATAKKDNKSDYEEWSKNTETELVDFGPSENAWVSFLKKGEDDEPSVSLGEFKSTLDQLSVSRAFTLNFEYKMDTMEKGEERLVFSKFDGDRGLRVFALYGDAFLPNRYRFRVELAASLKQRNLISITTQSVRYGNIKPGSKVKLFISYDGSGMASGLLVGGPTRLTYEERSVVDQLDGDFSNQSAFAFGEDAEGLPGKGGVSRIGYFDHESPLFLSAYKSQKEALQKIVATAPDERSKRDERSLQNYYHDILDKEVRSLRVEQASLEKRYKFVYDLSTVSLVMKEKEEDPFAFMLERGVYDAKGDKVYPELPAALGGMPEGFPRNRLGLAQWLVSPENPLTARVTVNRVWQNLFGIGLVRTSEDFGIMGENPSHPELLDWLAVDFQENGWDFKGLVKKMVMSKTYRQDSRIDREEYSIDSENRFLARGPRYRLDAEAIRDQALVVSGLLNGKVGGPPVRPYQPKGIWNAVAYSGSNTRYYVEGEGDELYRRSLYTFWKRTAPPASMSIFDAPSRENCSVRRERTNTPLQALTLMNDPQYVEAARHLAQRALGEEESEVEDRINAMYRFALGEEAPPKFMKTLTRSYERFEGSFRSNPEGAAQLVEVGNSARVETEDIVGFASLTMVANQIMNLDNFINKY